jgi:GTP-binding protein YchF
VVSIPDDRLVKLSSFIKAREITPASIKFMDLAGLIKGASHGEGLGNKFLAEVREADALLHVVRCFEDSDISHIEKDLNPERDIDIINLELGLADLEIVEKRLDRIAKLAHSGDKKAHIEELLLGRLREALNRGEMVRMMGLLPEEKELLKEVPLLTLKPVIYMANTGEKDSPASKELVEAVIRKVSRETARVIKVAAKLENELRELPEEEGAKFRGEWTGEKESPLKRLVRASYDLLDLVTFYSVANEKISAWPLKKGGDIVTAASKIHTDMARGFIKAEVINFEELMEIGSFNLAREKGRIRFAGRDYQVRDGDIVYIHFTKNLIKK